MTQSNASNASDTKHGTFITFEGGEGVGKSTHIRFLAQTLKDRGYEVVSLREPGGTSIGEALREVVLSLENMSMDPVAELFIYEAARAQIVAEVIRPALNRGAVVLCDRFADSTIAYQAYGRGLPLASVKAANEFATGGLVPDRTILLTCPPSDGLERATHHAPADRLESEGVDFHARVNEGFRALACAYPERVRVIESCHAKSATSAAIFSNLADMFPWMADLVANDPGFFAPLDRPHPHADERTTQPSGGTH